MPPRPACLAHGQAHLPPWVLTRRSTCTPKHKRVVLAPSGRAEYSAEQSPLHVPI